MPDLATHSILSIFLHRLTRDRLMLLIMVVGTILPDVMARAPVILTSHLDWLSVPFHSPIPLFILAYLFSMLFQEYLRKKVFLSLLAGMYLHLVADMTQWHIADGNYFWMYPFSRFQFELGLVESNDIFRFLPVLLLCFILFETIRARLLRKLK